MRNSNRNINRCHLLVGFFREIYNFGTQKKMLTMSTITYTTQLVKCFVAVNNLMNDLMMVVRLWHDLFWLSVIILTFYLNSGITFYVEIIKDIWSLVSNLGKLEIGSWVFFFNRVKNIFFKSHFISQSNIQLVSRVNLKQ